MPREAKHYTDWQGSRLRCPSCTHDEFYERRVNLASPGTEFFNVEFLSPSAQALTCARCRLVLLYEEAF